MSRQPPELPADDEDARLEQSIERGLHRERLSPEALARIRVAVEAEFRSSTRHTARRWPLWALAAGFAALALAVALLWSTREAGPIVAQVARVQGGDLTARDGILSSREIGVGTMLRTGQELQARGAALVTLAAGGILRMAPDTHISIIARDELQLLRGKVYLDFPEDVAPYRVRSAAGTVEHVGTQFEVGALNEDVRVRVREGTVRLHGAHGSETAAAGTELLVTAAGEVVRKPVPTYGDDWTWVESIAPDYEIENRPLGDFLTWVARETGRHVEFVDGHAREIALRTQLHGSVRGLAPLDALNRVLSTTTLRFELHGDAIRVSSRP